MGTPRTVITVITVVKDDYRGMLRTLQSLERFSTLPLEIIIVDGTASSNLDQDKFTSITSLRVAYFQSEAKGIYNAMNVGAHKSNGEWLWFLNAGDYCVALATQLGELLRLLDNLGSQVLCAVSPVAITTKNGNLYDVDIPRISNMELHCNHQGAFVRRSAYLKAGGFDESLKMAADGKLLDAIAGQGEIEIIDFVITSFVIGGASAVNFRTTLKEISTYRERRHSNFFDFGLLLKTQLRNYLLSEEFSDFKVLNFYLRLREEKIRRKLHQKILLPSSRQLIK